MIIITFTNFLLFNALIKPANYSGPSYR